MFHILCAEHHSHFMAKKPSPKKEALLFIDTNIFLDFYRFRNTEVSIKFLDEIKKHKDILITTKQVEMEFKKNRQTVLLSTFGELKKYKTENYKIPEVLENSVEIDNKIKEASKIIENELKKLPKKMEELFKNKINDPVFTTAEIVFKNESPYNLKDLNEEIFTLSKRRFKLGYPPRKNTDNSIGDSINWEWIINCGKVSKKDIIIVTRDGDYGLSLNGEPYLNDFLIDEFTDRTKGKNKITVTNKLATAFKLVEIPVSQEMINEENEISTSKMPTFKTYLDLIKKLKENGTLDQFVEKSYIPMYKHFPMFPDTE